MADGIFYRDLRMPTTIIDETAITLTTTAKALWPVARSILPANYWNPGKTVSLTMYGLWITGTAGNVIFSMALGTGDNPAVIVSSVSRAKVASVAGGGGLVMKGYATCRSIGVGTAATISMWGYALPDLAVMLSTADLNVFPSAGVTVVSTFDSTLATLALTFQMTMSAGTDTVTVKGLVMEALN